MPSWVLILASLAYIGLLFAIAYYGDKRADEGRSLINNPYIYALSMGVYCTAWTFYGSVGRSATDGLGFLPIYLGPTLMAALWWLVLRKMIRISKVNRITSIADFIGSRYGKSQALAGLVTIIAVVGIIPYISLQLKGVSNSFTVLSGNISSQLSLAPLFSDTAFYVTAMLAVFAILFGTRHLDVTEHHEGLVVAIAFESVLKLIAFLAVGVFVTLGMYDGFGHLFEEAAKMPELAAQFTLGSQDESEWFWLTGLSMMAILFLPRQFQMAVVENVNEAHLKKAVWLFPLYLLAINFFVWPIAIAGVLHFPNGGVDADTFVLMLPLIAGQEVLAVLVFLGGLSAATGMVIVETVALSTMISNDLVMPVLLRSPRWATASDLSGILLTIRRVAIIIILLLGYVYFRLTATSLPLVSIGLISFAAVAQFAPAILGGMYWKGGTRVGALVGLTLGFVIWSYTLLLPSFVESGLLPASFLVDGPFGIGFLRPHALFGLANMEPISHALFWSLLANAGSYITVSLLYDTEEAEDKLHEQRQATLFVDVWNASRLEQASNGLRLWRSTARVLDLRSLLTRFLGSERAESLLSSYAQKHGLELELKSSLALADDQLIDFAEKSLAGAIGAASARVMVSSIVKERPLGMDQVMQILDEKQEVMAYSQQLEEKSRELEAASAELRTTNEALQTKTVELQAAYEQLKELDQLKDDFMSTVTHELRTPLTSIRGFAEILHHNPELAVERRQQFLHIIVDESERLTRLINNVLDLTKMERGAMTWELSSLDLKAIVEESMIIQFIDEEQIKVESSLPDEVPFVVADQDKLVQVMLNLLSNAAKFTKDWVKIELLIQPNALQVNVSDNGRGVKPEEHEMIFEKFRQVGDTLTDKPKGTGLGLPISRHIIEHFGGQLWLESTPGEGATFSFTLPLEEATHG